MFTAGKAENNAKKESDVIAASTQAALMSELKYVFAHFRVLLNFYEQVHSTFAASHRRRVMLT
jgi:hypothetical protein